MYMYGQQTRLFSHAMILQQSNQNDGRGVDYSTVRVAILRSHPQYASGTVISRKRWPILATADSKETIWNRLVPHPRKLASSTQTNI
jgi:hypothetical protein